jgi:hypothetical protein
MVRIRMEWLAAAGAAVLLVGCQTITEKLGETPTEPEAVATAAPITIPIILPASNPPPTPTPTPTPASPFPGPAPEPTPTPESNPAPPPTSGSGCGASPSSPSRPTCVMDPPLFLSNVDNAITRVTQKHPELFNFKDARCPNCYYVKDVDAYVAQVQRELAKQGLCSFSDGEEIGVKQSNNRSDQYDIILASNHIRRGDGSYRGNCYPAIF